MSGIVDLRNLSKEKSEQLASRIQVAHDFALPHLKYWNYQNCRQHRSWIENYYDEQTQQDKQRTVTTRPKPGCRKCGIHFRRHQRVGITWLYFKKRALLADTVGPQPFNSLVLTPDRGYVRMGDIQVGDKLIDPKGEDSEVVSIQDKGMLQAFELKFEDGTTAQSSLNHKWVVGVQEDDLSWHEYVLELEDIVLFMLAGLKVLIPTYDATTKTQSNKELIDVYPVGKLQPHQCITVSANSHLYVTDNNTVSHNSGKSLSIYEPVLTPTGWVEMGKLKLGDKVIDPEGEASEVTGIYPQGELPAFRVTFCDDTSVVASEDHLWKVRTRINKKIQKNQWRVLTTQQIQKIITNSKQTVFVPLSDVPDLDNGGNRPVDPYLLGLLLGDGNLTTHSPRFFSEDQELFDSLIAAIPEGITAKFHKDETRCRGVRVSGPRGNRKNPLTETLRQAGVWGEGAREKHVPEQYLFAPTECRLALLQGLMDTDGSISGAQSIEFGTSSTQLAKDVAFLARSLGMRAKIAYRPKTDSWRVGLHRSTVCPFRLTRKASLWKPSQRPKTKMIKSIVPENSVQMQCIKVSAPSSLFITNGWTVTHNTAHAAGLIAMIKEAGELDDDKRVIICCRAPAILQWRDELTRMLPLMNIAVSTGSRTTRINRYLQPWEVMLIGPEMLLHDYEALLNFPLHTLIIDDVDALRNSTTRTSYVLKRVGRRCERMVIMTGTPLQKKLHELHSVLDPIGGREIFGHEKKFMRRYVRQETVDIYNQKTGKKSTVTRVTGYKNVGEFKRLIAPLALRRVASDIDDVELPAVIPSNVELELYKPQRDKYEELKQGVITILKTEGAQVKHTTALSKLHYGAQICGGLASLGEPDAPGTSVKMDWIMEKLSDGGDLEDEKVVIFCAYKNTIKALQQRLFNANIGQVTIWGEDADKESRRRAQARFWEDPKCRVLLGTQAIEQSLNLQVARHLINVDMIRNPARMEQLAGRIRRDGSAFKHVYVHNLLTIDTQEERYLPMLEAEQALIDNVWGERSELFDQLSPMALLQLISG